MAKNYNYHGTKGKKKGLSRLHTDTLEGETLQLEDKNGKRSRILISV